MAQNSDIIIIAEAGVNHNGSLSRALAMVETAARAGADYIKFQTFKAERLVTAAARKAAYQKTNQPEGDTQFEMLRALELSDDDFRLLADKCRRCGIGFMSTPFDKLSADFLATIGMDYWKIPSGEITNLPFLRHIAQLGGHIILSTGMSTLDEVSAAINVLTSAGAQREDITLLHCTTQYPAPFDSVNLRAMDTLATLGCGAVGYSDHTPGIEVAIAAAARGAKVIEKHFTLDRTLPGPDHAASLEPEELCALVRAVRNVATALGTGTKTVADAERPNITIARKSIVAARHISAGEIFTADNLTVKRPGDGICPMRWDDIIGQTAVRDFDVDEQIEL